MYAEERQEAIAALVAKRGRVSVLELADEFSVTTETVRRDLSTLERRHLLRRVHGGALSNENITVLESALSEREVDRQAEKQRIAAAAIPLIPAGTVTVFLDAGTTTARLADALPLDRAITVFTHSVSIAARVAGRPNIELHLLPGRVRPTTQAAVGVETVSALARIRADIAFMGANALSVAHGYSTPDTAEAATKAAMIASSQRSVVLADSSKQGLERAVRFADLCDIDVLVTDAITDELLTGIERASMEVILA